MADRASKRRIVSVLLLSASLMGCAAAGTRDPAAPTPLASGPEVDAAVYTDLIQGMLEQRQYYAALAHIEQSRIQQGDRPILRLYEGRALYGLELDGQAEAAFRRLLRGPLDAEANHGLGLVLASREPDLAIDHLVAAVRGRPTDVRMRNDLGFALMRAGRYRDARLQLSTAVELAPEDRRARNNLILLLLVGGDEAGARGMARDVGIDDARLADMRREAQRLRQSHTVPSNASSGR